MSFSLDLIKEVRCDKKRVQRREQEIWNKEEALSFSRYSYVTSSQRKKLSVCDYYSKQDI